LKPVLNRGELADAIDTVLAKERADTWAKTIEKCAKAVCKFCNEGVELNANGQHVWHGPHPRKWDFCAAAEIWKLRIKTEGGK
jgi:hypothetical protein